MINRSIECRRHVELEVTLRLALEEMKAGSYACAIDRLEEALAQPAAVVEPHIAEQHKQEPQPPYKFERYVSGSLRAQGVMVERATKLADAMRIAAKICPPANPPSAPTVLVYTTPPQRKPLTDEEAMANFLNTDVETYRKFKTWEAAHGIKE